MTPSDITFNRTSWKTYQLILKLNVGTHTQTQTAWWLRMVMLQLLPNSFWHPFTLTLINSVTLGTCNSERSGFCKTCMAQESFPGLLMSMNQIFTYPGSFALSRSLTAYRNTSWFLTLKSTVSDGRTSHLYYASYHVVAFEGRMKTVATDLKRTFSGCLSAWLCYSEATFYTVK